MIEYELDELLKKCSIEFRQYGATVEFKVEKNDNTIQLKFYMNGMLLDSITIGKVKKYNSADFTISLFELIYEENCIDKIKDFVKRWKAVFNIIKENLTK